MPPVGFHGLRLVNQSRPVAGRHRAVVADPPDAERELARRVAARARGERSWAAWVRITHLGVRRRGALAREVGVADAEVAEVPRPRERRAVGGGDHVRQPRPAAGARLAARPRRATPPPRPRTGSRRGFRGVGAVRDVDPERGVARRMTAPRRPRGRGPRRPARGAARTRGPGC